MAAEVTGGGDGGDLRSCVGRSKRLRHTTVHIVSLQVVKLKSKKKKKEVRKRGAELTCLLYFV